MDVIIISLLKYLGNSSYLQDILLLEVKGSGIQEYAVNNRLMEKDSG